MGKKPNVAIIGAGFSGLRCADILTQNGAQVTVFEARNRVGGRIHQSNIGDHLIDLGPNWIHGTGTNPIAAIAELTKTTVEDFEGNQVIISTDGSYLNDDTATKISEFLWTTIEEAFEYSNIHKDTIPPERSLFEFFQEKVEKADFTLEEKKLCIETSRLWGAYVGDPIERQSLKFFCLEECIDGNNYFVASTYKDILKHVSKAAIQHTDLQLNQPIIKIDSSLQQDPSACREITLTTATGETHKFDEVVMTTPLGWLKRNKSAFSPELPPRLIQAIDSISYGRLEKVYVTFPQAFWQKTPSGSNITPNTTTKSSAYERPTFAQFLDPTYTEGPEGILWNQECLSLAALPEHSTQWQNDPYAGNGSYCNFQVGLEQGDRDIEILRAGLGADRGVWFAGEHTAPFVALGTTTGAYWSGERAAGQICQFGKMVVP
ncbi:hypothetical protein BBP40_011121 [Aspergillus hancockii]|nr:hypothetical protein BBP40_011121 [Aspergillus hancockii]